MRLNLGRDKEGGCDGALEEVAKRHILVYFLGNLRVRVWALESVLMHSKRREHKLPPDLGLGPEDLGRRYVNGVGSIVTFELYKQNPLKTQSWQSFLFWLEASLATSQPVPTPLLSSLNPELFASGRPKASIAGANADSYDDYEVLWNDEFLSRNAVTN